jgi:hypothetical protein
VRKALVRKQDVVHIARNGRNASQGQNHLETGDYRDHGNAGVDDRGARGRHNRSLHNLREESI